jgi:hypothetical protein
MSIDNRVSHPGHTYISMDNRVISIEEVDACGLLNDSFENGSSPSRQGNVMEEGNYWHVFTYIRDELNFSFLL